MVFCNMTPCSLINLSFPAVTLVFFNNTFNQITVVIPQGSQMKWDGKHVEAIKTQSKTMSQNLKRRKKGVRMWSGFKWLSLKDSTKPAGSIKTQIC